MNDTPVTARLGWPGAATPARPGLGWPAGPLATPSFSGSAVITEPAAGEPTVVPQPPTPSGSLNLAPEAAPAAPVSRETTDSQPTAAEVAAERQLGNGSTQTPLADDTQRRLAGLADARARVLPRPAETRVLVVANQKGGVGKTTTAVNVAAALAQQGMKVLVVDLDPQGNASTALSIDHTEGTPGTYQVLIEGTPMDDVLVECEEVPRLFVVPASIDLAGAEIELVSMVARETRLRRALDTHLAKSAAVDDRYDYVFIDCPPSLGLLTVNALSAARELLIPIQCEYYALEGLTSLLRTIDSIREHLNPQLVVGAILLTMYDARTRLAAGVADEVRHHFGDVVLKTAVPRSVRISEAPSYGQTVVTYDPSSAGSLSYLEAASELAQQVKDPDQRKGTT